MSCINSVHVLWFCKINVICSVQISSVCFLTSVSAWDVNYLMITELDRKSFIESQTFLSHNLNISCAQLLQYQFITVTWYERQCISNHRPLDCLFFGFCSPVSKLPIPSQRASNEGSFSMSWRRHVCHLAWWRHKMETFSALLALCEGKPPVTAGFPSQRPVTLSFGVFSDRCLYTRLNKQSRRWRFETPLHPLWRHCNSADCFFLLRYGGPLFRHTYCKYANIHTMCCGTLRGHTIQNIGGGGFVLKPYLRSRDVSI